jgi:hypothetical protein
VEFIGRNIQLKTGFPCRIWQAEQSEWIMPHRGLQERDLVGVCLVVVVDTAQQVCTVTTVTLVEMVTLVEAVGLVETVTGDECEDIMLLQHV